MSFQNLQIDIDGLPCAETIEFQPMAPAYPRHVLLRNLIIFGPICVAGLIPGVVLIAIFRTGAAFVVGPLLALVPVALAALFVPLAVRRAKTAGFGLRQHDIALRRGVFFRKVVIVPFNRLQHAEVSSGPLQRRFGLASLKLYTAGASGVDLQIDGLTMDQAEALREQVTARAGAVGAG